MRRLSTKGKRLLASLLAAGMVAGMMPVSAFADDQVPPGTDDAVTAVTAGSSVDGTGQEDGSTKTGEPSGASESEDTDVSEETSTKTDAPETDAPEGSETGDDTTGTGDTGNGTGGDASTGSNSTGTSSTPSAQSPVPGESDTENPKPDKEEADTSSEPSQVNTLDAEDVNTHIATWVNTVPEGIEWAEGVTADTFDTAWETVTAADKEGTTYTVEVVPEGAVYFVDSFAATDNAEMADHTTTKPYEAIKTLVGEDLMNEKSDQFFDAESGWGLVDTDAKTKGYIEQNGTDHSADKDYTGIYGKDNAAGETLTYQFTLPAGTYTLTSYHREWWDNGDNKPRASTVTLKDAAGSTLGTDSYVTKNSSDNHTVVLNFTLTSEQLVSYEVKADNVNGVQAPAISWVGIARTGDAPEEPEEPGTPPTQPTLPEGFTGPLEETEDGLTYASGAVTEQVSGMDTVFVNNTQWNNGNGFHATFTDPSVFNSKAFTVLFDIKPTTPSGDNTEGNNAKRAALTIGTETNKLRIALWTDKIGYGTNGNDGGVSANSAALTGCLKNDWNSVAVVYHEDGDANGAVEVYINGALAGSVEDLGFKFSETDGLSAMLARSFSTSYMQEGTYDNIVVGPVALDADLAMAETAWRAYQKDNLPKVNTAGLEAAVEKAEQCVAEGFTSDRLTTALATAKALLEREDLTEADQDDIDAAVSELNAAISEVNPTDITLTKEAVDEAAANINGLTWKGWGMLNGNSTSNLLLDYKAEHPDEYWEMMEYLFGGEYPLFTHIKMEMGNDGNNSTGAEACTMRYENEEADASRSPGFVMAADAKKINPDVKVSVLRWGMPTWVQQKWDSDRTGAGYEAMYKWYKETIFDAYEKFGYVVDFVNPDKNETTDPDEDFIKWFANRVANETEFPDYFDQAAIDAYHNIRIIASDENKTLNIVPSMRADEDLYNAVDIIGFHYRTNATEDYATMADVDDKEVWYSEGCATFGYSELQENKNNATDNQSGYGAGTIGGYQSPLALADSIPNAFMASRRSHYIFQPAIGSFYEGIQYAHKELLSARDPWSGYIHYDPALQMIAHFSRFAVTGWEDSDPTQNEIWRMIASASHGSFGGSENEHATAGINGDASYLTLAAPNGEDFSVVFVNNTQNEKTFRINVKDLPEAAAKSLQTWVTQTDSYMKEGTTVEANDGSWVVTIPAYSIVTATTLDYYSNGAHSEEIELPEEGIRTADRTVLDTDSTGKNPDTDDTYLYADDFDYEEEGTMKQYNAVTGKETELPYLTARGNEPRYMLDSHGAWVVEDGRLTQELNAEVSQWNGGDPATIVGDFRWMNYLASVDVQIPNADANVWTGLGIRSQTGMNWNQDGYTLRIYGNGRWEFYRAGSVLGSGSVTADPDGSYNLKVAANNSTITAVIDGVTVYTYEDANPFDAGRVKLSSGWNKVYFDNLAVTTIPGTIPYATSMVDGQDDSVTYEGSWSIPGPGGGSADDWYRTTSTNTADGASFTFTFPVEGTGFAITGVNDGSANLTVYVDDKEVETDVATSASSRRYETYTLTGLDYAKHTVKVVVNSGKLVIDALYTLGQPLESAEDALVEVTSELPTRLAATVGGSATANLPETVEVVDEKGKTQEMAITWTDGSYTEPWSVSTLTGTVQDGVTTIGLPLTVSIPVEVVPENTVYFIDPVEGDPSKLETTAPYDVVSALLGEQLLNKKYDQKTDGTWGLVDSDAQTKGYDSTDDKTATGIYGHDNAAGETLTYELTLPAGAYAITSAHREWWGMDRPMTATVTAADGTELASANIGLSGSSGDIVTTSRFLLEKEQTIRYTLTATGTEAPVISWLGVCELDPGELTNELADLAEQIRADVAANQAAGIIYAEQPLEDWQYTGSGAVAGEKDSLADLNEVLAKADALVASEDPAAADILACCDELQAVYDNLRTLPETYTSIPGTTGDTIVADTGLPMQAHGGSVLTMVEGSGEGQVNYDLDGDGEVTAGKTVYLWYGEDKTNDTHPVDGVRCYVSTDLYNWSDRGLVLYTQDSVVPIEEGTEAAITSEVGADGEGTTQNYNVMQRSEENLEYIKSIGKLATAPEGMSESDFIEIKNFLRAYVTEFEVAPTDAHDVNWVAKSYDETPITASSFLYPDSQTVGTQQTTPLQLAFEGLYGGYCITERPKVIYNESTNQYVMIFHADGVLYNNQVLHDWVAGGCQGNCSASRYSRAMVGFATSATPFGPFKLVNMTRMNYSLDYSQDRLGEARDMTVFVDKGVDRNNDGADDAYVVYSSEMNAKLYISLLNKDYTAPAKPGNTAVQGTDYAARILSDDNREAPALFKYDGWYYLITSGTDGWNSTDHIYYRSRDLFSGWEKVGNPALNDTGKCFNTQVTYVIPIDAENGKFIYMGDRWNGNDLSESRTVWLPIRMNVGNTLSILNETYWTIDRLDQIAPAKVISEMPEVIYADGHNLPDVVTVKWQDQEVQSRVESWSGTDVMGYTTLTATLADCVDADGNKVQAQVYALVMPEDLVYFANPGDSTSDSYTAIVEASKETLKSAEDGEYSEAKGFGFVGNGYSVRENGSSLYDSLRYADSDTTASLSYQFDLPAGQYEVYIGMYDPSGWYQYSDRRADIKVNGEVAFDNYAYVQNCPATPDTLHTTATVGEDGKLNVEIAPHAGTDASVQFSFIMVAGQPTERVKVRFETNGGSLIDSQVIPMGGTIEEPKAPTRDLYRFTGWYTDAALTQKFDFATPITADITLYAGWEQEFDLVIEDLTEEDIPEELKDQYPTLDALQEAMRLEADVALQQSADGIAYYDVTLYLVDKDGHKFEVTDENFPAEGVKVSFDYPVDETTGEKITGSDHMFTVVHMLDNGDMEVFKDSDILYTDKDLTVTVHSLSPFAVAWRDRPAPAPSEPSEGNGTGGNTQTSADGTPVADAAVNGTAGGAASAVPQTSDPMPVEALAVVALLAAAAVVVLLVLRRKNKHK